MRSAMPGSVASTTCSPSNTRCSYTSSVTARTSRSAQWPAISSSSAREKTLPVGLCGVLRSTRRVRGAERGRELVRVERPVRRAQRHDPPLRAGHGDAGGVGVVERLEAHDLVAGLAQREQGGGDRLRGARGDQDLAVGVELLAVEAQPVGGDRVAQLGDAGAGRVLVVARADGRHGGLQHLLRPVRVGEALPEVERAGAHGERRHLGEDRRAEAGQLLRQEAARTERHGREPRAWGSARRGSAGRAPRGRRAELSKESSRSDCTAWIFSSRRRSTSSLTGAASAAAIPSSTAVCRSGGDQQCGPDPTRVAAAAPRAALFGGVGDRAAVGADALERLAGGPGMRGGYEGRPPGLPRGCRAPFSKPQFEHLAATRRRSPAPPRGGARSPRGTTTTRSSPSHAAIASSSAHSSAAVSGGRVRLGVGGLDAQGAGLPVGLEVHARRPGGRRAGTAARSSRARAAARARRSRSGSGSRTAAPRARAPTRASRTARRARARPPAAACARPGRGSRARASPRPPRATARPPRRAPRCAPRCRRRAAGSSRAGRARRATPSERAAIRSEVALGVVPGGRRRGAGPRPAAPARAGRTAARSRAAART